MLHKIDPDAHGPLGQEMASAVSTCVHCGFCLSACPTYQTLELESDSPRGRIVLMKEVLEGELALDDALPHIDRCLGCLACEPACPSGVPYHQLISPFRALSETQRRRNWGDRFIRFMTQLTLPYPARFRWAARLARLGQPMAKWLPKRMKTMLDLVPNTLPPRVMEQPVYPAQGTRRARVALLTGCAQSVLDPDINLATIDVLTRNGVEVVVPPEQTCCGALSWHVGNLTQARRFARANLAAFPTDVDAIVTNAAGCGSGMQEYGMILKGTAEHERARHFADRVIDVSKFLVQLSPLEPIPNKSPHQRIAYHDPCHLAHAQGVASQPRKLLRMIPGVELCEIPSPHICCGSAGTYNIDQPEIAETLGRQKAEHVASTNADLVATGNIGCMTQLKLHLQKLDRPIPVRHTMQVLRDAYATQSRPAET